MVKVASLVFFTVLGCVLAAPAEQEPVAILAQESDIQPDGSFKWSFETADGVKQEQTGQPKQVLLICFLFLICFDYRKLYRLNRRLR